MNSLSVLLTAATLAATACAHAGDSAPDTLELDAAFAGAPNLEQPGMAFYHDLGAANRIDSSLGLFAADAGGYWLAGRHVDPDHLPSDTVLIAKLADDGSYDETFGSDGQVTFDVLGPHGSGVAVATKARGSDTFYFAGPIDRADGSGEYDVGVSCANADGSPCAAFGDGGLVVFPLLDANYTQAVAIAVDESARVIVLGGCKIAGSTNPGGNLDMCTLALDAGTGAPVEGFGNAGMSRVGVDVVADGWDIAGSGTPMVMTGADSPNGARIFVSGGLQVEPWSPSDPLAMLHDRAFVVAIDAVTGRIDPSFGDAGHIIYDDGDLSFVTAMAVRGDGSLLLAGQTVDSDLPGQSQLLLAAVAPDGSYLPSFCGGSVCIGNPDGLVKAVPRAVAVRQGSGNVVLATEASASTSLLPTEIAIEAGANGTSWRSVRRLDYAAADGQMPTAEVTGLQIDAQNRVLMVGARQWSVDQPVSQFDITLARMVDADTLFVSGFER